MQAAAWAVVGPWPRFTSLAFRKVGLLIFAKCPPVQRNLIFIKRSKGFLRFGPFRGNPVGASAHNKLKVNAWLQTSKIGKKRVRWMEQGK